METMYCYRPEGEKPVRCDVCDYCGTEINVGEDYFKIEQLSLCEECINEFKCIAGEE